MKSGTWTIPIVLALLTLAGLIAALLPDRAPVRALACAAIACP